MSSFQRRYTENIQASGPVTLLRLNVTKALLGELLLCNRFMHINEMAMKVRQPSPSSEALGVRP